MTPAIIFVTVFAGLFGLVIGSFLNVVAYRVPRGITLLRESRCPHCVTPIRWYQNIPVLSWLVLRGKCAACWSPISPRYPIVEAITGILFTLVALGVIFGRPIDQRPTDGQFWFGTPEFWGVLITLEIFAALSVVLTLIDLEHKRLPNAIVLPGWAVIVGMLALTAALTVLNPVTELPNAAGVSPAGISAPRTADWWPLGRALIGGIVLFLFYYVVRWISPRGMGGGDVKLAGLTGTVLGWFGWSTLIVGAFSAFVLGGLFGVALLLFGRAKRKTAIPFGPWMLAGAWMGIVFGEPIGRWYLGLMS